MTGLLSRVGRLFVAPPALSTTAFAPPRSRAPMAGVLAAERDLLVAAGAVAAELRRAAGSRAAVVCAWRGHDQPPLAAPAPATPAAARTAEKLARRGLAARGCGCLCVVELAAEPAEASAAFRDAVAAADLPAVLALARRDAGMDGLLGEADRLVLSLGDDIDPVLAELAAAGLAQLGPPVERLSPPPGVVARQAARLGLARLAPPPAAAPRGAAELACDA